MATGPHFCGSWNITKQKKVEKLMQCPSIKFPPLWYGSDFFFIHIKKLLLKNAKITHFLNEISSQNFKVINGPRFN
jgi:hypothetical protein